MELLRVLLNFSGFSMVCTFVVKEVVPPVTAGARCNSCCVYWLERLRCWMLFDSDACLARSVVIAC
jgi:hypothetical protein